jgi:NADPH2:quinone reductase
MLAAAATSFGGPAAVEVIDAPEPVPGDDHVIVDVVAAGLTFPDVLQTRGAHQIRHELPFVLGTEAAGRVRHAPPGSGLAVGRRVVVLGPGGALAEQAAAPPSMVLPLPDDVAFENGVAIPANYLTALFGLRDRAGLRPGDVVLVHGAGSGVGLAAVEVAVLLGATVVAVASDDEKRRQASGAGAHHVVPPAGFHGAVTALLGPAPVDVVFDPVGGDRFVDSLRLLRARGRLLVVGFAAGTIPEVRVNRLLLRNLSVVGVNWGAEAFADPAFAREQWDAALPWVTAGHLRPDVQVLDGLGSVAAGLRMLEDRAVAGKLVVRVAP